MQSGIKIILAEIADDLVTGFATQSAQNEQHIERMAAGEMEFSGPKLTLQAVVEDVFIDLRLSLAGAEKDRLSRCSMFSQQLFLERELREIRGGTAGVEAYPEQAGFSRCEQPQITGEKHAYRQRSPAVPASSYLPKQVSTRKYEKNRQPKKQTSFE